MILFQIASGFAQASFGVCQVTSPGNQGQMVFCSYLAWIDDCGAGKDVTVARVIVEGVIFVTTGSFFKL